MTRASILVLILIILACAIACQPTLVVVSPSVTDTLTPGSTPAPIMAARATQTPRQVASAAPSATSTPRPSPTRWPFAIMMTPGEGPPPGTLDPTLLTQVALRASGSFPTPQVGASPLPLALEDGTTLLVGTSVEGRPIVARRFGVGERVILLAGGMHGGWEANTVALIDALIDHFEASPQDVLPGITLLLIPVVNPDGLVRGRTPEGRFNANGVDLNRNWGCTWAPEAIWRDQPVNPGPAAFSEPETAALSEFIASSRPVVALFYHSAADGVYAGYCNGDHGSAAMSAVLGRATGYSHGQAFSAYPVSGTAASWADGQGIASADVELAGWTDPEFERNLRGVMALQQWLLGR